MASFALEELGEIIIVPLFFTLILGVMLSLSNEDLKQSELYTSETAAISSIIPKDTQVSIQLQNDASIEFLNNQEYVIAVNKEFSEQYSKKLPKETNIEIQGNTLIITS